MGNKDIFVIDVADLPECRTALNMHHTYFTGRHFKVCIFAITGNELN